jgi:hypothetical protein
MLTLHKEELFSQAPSRATLKTMKSYLILIFISLMLSLQPALATEINPFTTDNCTMWSEGTNQKPELWKHCCVEHDLFFWAGGTYRERETADMDLKKCIEYTGAKTQAKMMYLAVILGKYSPIKFSSKKWGNAWPWWRNYQTLNKDQVDLLLREAALSTQISPKLYEKFRLQLLSRQE